MIEVRAAGVDDIDAVAELAGMLSQSYALDRESFDRSYPLILEMSEAALLIAEDRDRAVGYVAGYVLGFRHPTFFANAPVALVEEILVRPELRGSGVGRALMNALEAWAADCALVSLSTRRAAPFYLALGYKESAVYFRKQL